MGQSRRWFLRTLGAGAAFVALPEISPIIEMVSLPGRKGGGCDPSIEALLLGREPGGPFVAHAETFVTEGTAQQLMNAPAALLTMLDRQGFGRTFSSRPDYSDAAQCKGNYECEVGAWRRRGFGDYTPVKRPAADRDNSIMVAGTIGGGHLVEAEGATQYQGQPAVTLSGNDPGALLAGWLLLAEQYNFSRREAAQGLTAIEKRSVTVNEGVSAVRYETPVSAVIHVPRKSRNSRLRRPSRGVVFAHNKKDRDNPNRIYYAEVFV